MEITEEQKTQYEIIKAVKLLKKHNLLEKSQETKIKDKLKDFKKKDFKKKDELR